MIIEDAPLQDVALVSENDSASLHRMIATLLFCTVTSADASSVTTETAVSISGIAPSLLQPTSMFSVSSDPLLATTESMLLIRMSLQSVPVLKYVMNVQSVSETGKRTIKNATAYVGQVRFDAIMAGQMLSDVAVNAAQVILRQQFPHIQGMQDTLLGSTLTFNVIPHEIIQILHDGDLHWLLVSTFDCIDGEVKIFDLLMSPPSLQFQLQAASLLSCPFQKMQCACQSCQLQKGGVKV